MSGFGTQLVDVAIGLMLMYTIVSLIASAVVELLETLLRTRSKYLWQGIGELLNDPITRTPSRQLALSGLPQEPVAMTDGDRMAAGESAAAPTNDRSHNRKSSGKKNSGHRHADKQKREEERSKQGKHGEQRHEERSPTSVSVRALYEHPLIAGLFYGSYPDAARMLVRRDLPSYIPRESFSTALIDVVSREHPDDPHISAAERLRRGIDALPASDIKQALQSITRVAGDDLTLIQRRIESWYDTAMDSVAGWYKRHSQAMLLLVGILLAAVGNLDSWRIAKDLAVDKVKREAVVASANAFFTTHTRDTPKLTTDDVQNVESLALLQAGGITWYSPIGWLITAFAVSLGAPFWFDLLNKIVVVRSTVKPKERTQETAADLAAGKSAGTSAPQTPSVFVRTAGPIVRRQSEG